jgi:hypothetical protein
MAVDLGIDLSQRPMKAKGLTGAINVVRVNVTLTLCDGNENHDLDIPAFVNLEMTNEVEAVLGRDGLFDKFRITFVEADGIILLEREERRIGCASIGSLSKCLGKYLHPATPVKA